MRRLVIIHQMARLRAIHPMVATRRRKPPSDPPNHIRVRKGEIIEFTRCDDDLSFERRERQNARIRPLA